MSVDVVGLIVLVVAEYNQRREHVDVGRRVDGRGETGARKSVGIGDGQTAVSGPLASCQPSSTEASPSTPRSQHSRYSNYCHFLIAWPKRWHHHLQDSGSKFVTNFVCFSFPYL